MAKIHSFLITNAWSELKFVETEISQEQLSNTFDEIANAITNDDEMFQNDDNDDNLVDDSDECLDISEEKYFTFIYI